MEKGLGDFLKFEQPYLQQVICRDDVDLAIIDVLLGAGSEGVFPKDIPARLAEHKVSRWHVSRRLVRMNNRLKELSQKVSIITRVVVHPKYRMVGLGHKLVRETLHLAGTPYVKTVAVIVRYNPFFQRGGMRKITESSLVKRAFKIAKVLTMLGFNITFLRSPKYLLKNLASLNTQELCTLKKAFAENKHPRFMQGFSFHDPYGKSKFYKKAVVTADLKKLTKLIGICGMLLQTKAYLFWQSDA